MEEPGHGEGEEEEDVLIFGEDGEAGEEADDEGVAGGLSVAGGDDGDIDREQEASGELVAKGEGAVGRRERAEGISEGDDCWKFWGSKLRFEKIE